MAGIRQKLKRIAAAGLLAVMCEATNPNQTDAYVPDAPTHSYSGNFQKGLEHVLVAKDERAKAKYDNKSPEKQGQSKHRFQDGDIIGQTYRASLSKWLAIGTESLYTHVGMIVYKGDSPCVVEAEGSSVHWTSLDAFIKRGYGNKYTVMRLNSPFEDKAKDMANVAQSFLGKGYDFAFDPSDSRMYCSELVEKAAERGAGVELAKWRKFKDIAGYSRYIPPIKKAIIARWGKMPDDVKMISPGDVMGSSKLHTVYSNYLF